MSQLEIFSAQRPDVPEALFNHHRDIARELNTIGMRFEQWQTNHPIQPGAPADEILTAYRSHIAALQEAEGYVTVDVVSISAAHPDKDALRQKFLSEHIHTEDEVRFFVAGQGLFSVHVDGKVYELLCEKGDLISLPAGTRHWFDMGPNPALVAIRFFNRPEGWVAQFTGDTIAERFHRLEN